MADFLSTLFSGGAQEDAAAKNAAALAQYQGQAQQALQTGYATGTSAINTGIGAYTPLAELGQTYGSGAPTLMAGLGVGTPDQIAAAKSTFQSSPGFSAMLDNAAQAVARQRAAGGMGASGNADIDAMMASAGLTSNAYNSWIQNLQNTGQLGVTATSGAAAGQAGQYDTLANLASQYGSNVAGVAGNVASGTMADNNMVAAGQAAGAKNLLGAGLSLASIAAGGIGGGGLGSILGTGGVSAVPGAVGPTSLGGQPLGQSPTLFGGFNFGSA